MTEEFAPLKAARVPAAAPKTTAAPEQQATPIVVLQQYAATPTLNFGDAQPKQCVKRTLLVVNESGRPQRVEVKAFQSKDAMRVYPSSMEVPAHGTKELSLSWTPGTAGVLSKRLELKWNQSNTVHAELRGTCAKARAAPPAKPAANKPAPAIVAPAVKALVEAPQRSPLSPSDVNRPRSFAARVPTKPAASDPDAPAPPADAPRPPSKLSAPPQPAAAAKPAAAPGRKLRLTKPAPAAPAAAAPPATTLATAAAATAEPFAAPPAALAAAGAAAGQPCGGMFFDDGWREKRVQGLTAWLNHVLADPLASAAGGAPSAMGAGERQRLTLRELEVKRAEAALRHKMAMLLRSPQVGPPLCRLEEQVHDKLVCIAPARNLHADVGQRTNLLNLLCCYNPLWLRLAAEAVSGEAAPPGTTDDAQQLRRFLDRRVLAAPAYVAPPAAGRHYELAAREAAVDAKDAAHKLLLRRVLSAIVLLDAAKRARVLSSDPCLFRPGAAVKSSREMAASFCREFVSGGVGDINRHLATLGCKLEHAQTTLDEYNFAVGAIAGDLKDGARLCRLLEMLRHGGERVLTPKLRLPAENLTNKKRNVAIALEAMVAAGLRLADSATAAPTKAELEKRVKAIVECQRDATLELLWRVAGQLALPALAPAAALGREAARARQLAKQAGRGAPPRSAAHAELGAMLLVDGGGGGDGGARLLEWASAVCWSHGRAVTNLGAALRDGAALCLLVHHYLPEQLPLAQAELDTAKTTTTTTTSSRSGANAEIDDDEIVDTYGAAAAKRRFAAFSAAVGAMGGVPLLVTAHDVDGSGAGPDERMTALMLGYLFRRLTQLTNDAMAARLLQGAWLARKRGLGPRERLRRALRAARIQRVWRATREARVARRRLRLVAAEPDEGGGAHGGGSVALTVRAETLARWHGPSVRLVQPRARATRGAVSKSTRPS